jgi:hypothetical protein
VRSGPGRPTEESFIAGHCLQLVRRLHPGPARAGQAHSVPPPGRRRSRPGARSARSSTSSPVRRCRCVSSGSLPDVSSPGGPSHQAIEDVG